MPRQYFQVGRIQQSVFDITQLIPKQLVIRIALRAPKLTMFSFVNQESVFLFEQRSLGRVGVDTLIILKWILKE